MPTARVLSLLLLAAVALPACGDDEPKETDETVETPITDADEDGYDAVEHGGDDCDDTDADIHPDATEHCDGVDEDCDGTVDDDAVDTTVWYLDGDGDGFGADDSAESACDLPSEDHVEMGDDCDDADPQVHPDATEDCTDSRDLDCDGDSGWADADGDGWAACEDCDDGSAAVNLDATEICNDIDDDCDGDVDGGAVDAPTWYTDADGDLFGDASSTTAACDQPEGYVSDATDCDDGRADVNPGADELCDEDDLDCDGDPTDGAVDMDTWYADVDGDGYGDEDADLDACEQPSGYEDDDEDCDDSDDTINPDADEDCDLVDNDCNGTVDDGCPEECDDGFDNDSDGYIDCYDSDCDLECPEDECDDGLDDDGDGLTDCEDGDCSDDAVCVEDCADSADNDADGLTDCEDDDCWGTSDCPNGSRAMVTAASSLEGWLASMFNSYVGCGYSIVNRSYVGGANAYSVEGVVQVLPASSMNWNTATSWTSCGWSATSVSFSVSSSSQNITRNGFTVDSGCGLSTSGFLPAALAIDRTHLAMRAGPAGSVPWYTGSVSTSTSTGYLSTFSLPCWGGGGWADFGQGSLELSWTLDPVSSGSYYTAAE